MPDNFDAGIYVHKLSFFSAYTASIVKHCTGNCTCTKWLLQLQVRAELSHLFPCVVCWAKKPHFIKENNWRDLPARPYWQPNHLFCKKKCNKRALLHTLQRNPKRCSSTGSVSGLLGFAKNPANPGLEFTIIITVYSADCNVLGQQGLFS